MSGKSRRPGPVEELERARLWLELHGRRHAGEIADAAGVKRSAWYAWRRTRLAEQGIHLKSRSTLEPRDAVERIVAELERRAEADIAVLRDAVEAVERNAFQTSAAEELGIPHATLQHRVKRAARMGILPRDGSVPPGFEATSYGGTLDEDGKFVATSVRLREERGPEYETPEGMALDRMTVQVGPDGRIERQWPKLKQGVTATESLLARARALRKELTPYPPTPRPHVGGDHLVTELVFSDLQIGRLAETAATGGEWNLDEAKRIVFACLEDLIQRAPASKTGVLVFLGDTAEFDGMKPVTPKSGNVLDAASTFEPMIEAVAEIERRALQLMLERFKEVHFVDVEANHDPASSAHRRLMWRYVFRDEPRIRIVPQRASVCALEFGKLFLGYHHGDKIKPEQLTSVLADEFGDMWGRTQGGYREAKTGHMHHRDTKEGRGVLVRQMPTLASRSRHEAELGHRAQREAICCTFDAERGARLDEFSTSPRLLGLE